MKIETRIWTEEKKWQPELPGKLAETAQLVLVFGSTSLIKEHQYFDELKKAYPKAHFFGCSTAGEIYHTEVYDDSLTVTAIHFESTRLENTHISINDANDSFDAGERLGQILDKKELVHVLVLCEGININGSELVQGLTKQLPKGVTITGGLAGDGDRFKETYILCDDKPQKNGVSALCLYGNRLKVGYASLGGWDPFGPERLITRSKGNVLYEMDGRSALELYKEYLGEHAEGLPATGLLFPLSIRTEGSKTQVVRTILATDENEQSLTFAGDVPEGSFAQLMKANFDRLIDGASGAAQTSFEAIGSSSPDLALLISCVGRKMVLKQRVEEEVEAVRDILGDSTVMTGFYSYGEISPFIPNAKCELHNQTMTITTLSEK